jgi:hypothetical protein
MAAVLLEGMIARGAKAIASALIHAACLKLSLVLRTRHDLGTTRAVSVD